ncbi:MAM and LDL-receptor class A domain-containing protein 2 [Caerostris extrusa]|uniref:MAM and LDL-receptor class A domain-containing protein 2 n=1 Tax=Caerostris extrusa TaxID=172846 RepID=A0AAV4MU47_CAEEX|nr:MAM and LDL-receptor class A domain-containing protein 2 [Caerostris extrusa]
MGWDGVNEIKSEDVLSDTWLKLETNITVENAGDFFQLGLTAMTYSKQDNDTHRGIAIDDLSLVKSLCGQEIATTLIPQQPQQNIPLPNLTVILKENFCLWENDPRSRLSKVGDKRRTF